MAQNLRNEIESKRDLELTKSQLLPSDRGESMATLMKLLAVTEFKEE
jgi:hypothetical protein